jgi:Uma2 family endonuclease
MYHAPLDVFLDENVLQPDLLFIKVERKASCISAEGKIVGVPDLVVEIWSPSNRKKEREEKRNVYETSGVAEYWSIYPNKQHIVVETLDEEGKYGVFSEAKADGIVKSKILDGFEIAVKDLMPEEALKTPKQSKQKGTKKAKNKKKN